MCCFDTGTKIGDDQTGLIGWRKKNLPHRSHHTLFIQSVFCIPFTSLRVQFMSKFKTQNETHDMHLHTQ